MSQWTDAQIKKAQNILARFPVSQFRDAVAAIEKATKREEVTPAALRSVFLRCGLGPPSSYCKEEEGEYDEEPEEAQPETVFQKLVQLTNKHPVAFSTLCDKLNLSPSKTKSLIEQARNKGVLIKVEHDHVGMEATDVGAVVQDVHIKPVVGVKQKVAVISDTHLGSKYCLRAQLKDFIHYAYSQGVREILHVGDILDGMYRHGTFEVSHTGLEDQTRDLYEVLPQLPGLTYHLITGNHDFTFEEHSGTRVSSYIRSYFLERGRKDLTFYGDRSAFLKIRGIVIHLWHPKKNPGYAKSYGLQKQIEKYTSIIPTCLLVGHWHIFNFTYESGVHAIACPTFQGGGSNFGKSLGGAPAIGGLILSWELTKDGIMRNFTLEKRSYYEIEEPVEAIRSLDAIPVR